MPSDPSRADQVAPALLAYLTARLSVDDLRFAEAPAAIETGWETHIYTFRLESDGVDPAWARPLILRVYPNAEQGERAEFDGAVQRFVVERGYPAPAVLAIETSAGALGRPFLIMERAPGRTMLDRLQANPISARGLTPLMAKAHADLHRLPVEACPLPADGTLVERQLVDFRRRIAAMGVTGTDDALAWLEAHKGMVMPEEASLCHNDFHPQNIVVDDEQRLSVIDWSGAALGDRHCDIASTLVLMRTAPGELSGVIGMLLDRFGRYMLVRRYLRGYRKHLPIDKDRLRYWEVLQTFEWWLRVAAIQSFDSDVTGLREGTAQRLPEGHLERIQRHFWQRARA
ncbi:MAG: phosphotransferase family protein [Dehalococcoidia bacterium]